MGIWNEIQEQLKELQQLLDERKQLDNLYNQIKKENDRRDRINRSNRQSTFVYKRLFSTTVKRNRKPN